MDLNSYQFPPQPDWCTTDCKVPHAPEQDGLLMVQPETVVTGQGDETAACDSASMDTDSASEEEKDKAPARKRQRRTSDTPEKWSEMIKKKLSKSKRTGQACDRCKASPWQDSILPICPLLAAVKLTWMSVL